MDSTTCERATQCREAGGDRWPGLRIAVLIPCYNEAAAIETVIAAFRATLPAAHIYVYDNNSTDCSAELALAAGADVRYERLQGKGNVLRRMFADIAADVYVLVDGDATYDAASAPRLIDTLLDGAYDMVTGSRFTDRADAYRPGHRFGNWLLTALVSRVFGNRTGDMLSGYRVLSRRFVKTFPALTQGFEVETELTVHALDLRMQIVDVPTPYKERPPGSASKLRTFHDGFRILWLILTLVKEERPLQLFTCLFGLFAVGALGLALPVFLTYLETGLVPRFPTAVAATGLMMLAFLWLTCGIILEGVTRGRREVKRLRYLTFSPPQRPGDDRAESPPLPPAPIGGGRKENGPLGA